MPSSIVLLRNVTGLLNLTSVLKMEAVVFVGGAGGLFSPTSYIKSTNHRTLQAITSNNNDLILKAHLCGSRVPRARF